MRELTDCGVNPVSSATPKIQLPTPKTFTTKRTRKSKNTKIRMNSYVQSFVIFVLFVAFVVSRGS